VKVLIKTVSLFDRYTVPTLAYAIMRKSLKRARPNDDNKVQEAQPEAVTSTSAAAKFNATVLKKLQRTLELDPEIDLTTALPSEYSVRLASRKNNKGKKSEIPFNVSRLT
jgi:hypothetical protein